MLLYSEHIPSVDDSVCYYFGIIVIFLSPPQVPLSQNMKRPNKNTLSSGNSQKSDFYGFGQGKVFLMSYSEVCTSAGHLLMQARYHSSLPVLFQGPTQMQDLQPPVIQSVEVGLTHCMSWSLDFL